MIITAKTAEYDSLRAEMHAQEARFRAEMHAQEARCRDEVAVLSRELAEARRQGEVLRLQVAELQRNADRRRGAP